MQNIWQRKVCSSGFNETKDSYFEFVIRYQNIYYDSNYGRTEVFRIILHSTAFNFTKY